MTVLGAREYFCVSDQKVSWLRYHRSVVFELHYAYHQPSDLFSIDCGRVENEFNRILEITSYAPSSHLSHPWPVENRYVDYSQNGMQLFQKSQNLRQLHQSSTNLYNSSMTPFILCEIR